MKKFCLILSSALLLTTPVWAEQTTEENIVDPVQAVVTTEQTTETAQPATSEEQIAETLQPVAEEETAAAATQSATQDQLALEKVLSDAYGADVKVDMADGHCLVHYPEATVPDLDIFSIITSGDAAPKTMQKVTIPKSEAICRKAQDFNTHTQYHISSTSPNKIKAQISNLLGVGVVNDISVQSVKEEWDVVPALGLTRTRNLQAVGLSYAMKMSESKRKEEIASLLTYSSQQNFSEENGKITYTQDSQINDLKAGISLFSLQVQGGQQHSEMVYSSPKQGKFDYQNILKNVGSLVSAKSAGVVNGIKLAVPMMGAGLSLDIATNNKTTRTEQATYTLLGSTVLKNISIVGAPIEAGKLPNNITVKYSLSELPADYLAKFAQLSDETDRDVRDLKIARLLDAVADKVKLVVNLDVYFAEGNILTAVSLTRKKGYAYGIGTVKATNLFRMFPNQAACAGTKSLNTTCPPDEFFMGLSQIIDTSKNNTETVYKFTEEGVFRNGSKIAPPVELNFEKMYRERKAQRIEMERQQLEWQLSQPRY